MFYVYMLKSLKNNTLYIGSTNNLRRRFTEHNSGHGGYTKKYAPYELVYYEAYKSEKDARERETNLKLRRNAFSQLKRRVEESIKAN
jgi:putative endonuclease